MDKFVSVLLEQMNRFDKVFFHYEYQDIRECRDAAHWYTCFRKGLGDGCQDPDFLRYAFLGDDLQTTPANFLLYVVRSHELGTDDCQFVIRPRRKAHVSLGEDHRDFGELWQLVDAELVFQHHYFQLLIHQRVTFSCEREIDCAASHERRQELKPI
jgi:hypothetical protein